MGVEIERDTDVRMTEALGHDLGVHASLERERRVRVTKVVKANMRNVDRTNNPVELPREPIRVDWPAEFVGHHEVD